jgi:DNA-binding LytR/AlgR family response regulator
LPENEFVRVHRSFIIPLNSINAARNKTISLGTDKEIPIGVCYEEESLKSSKRSKNEHIVFGHQ